ncbi:histidine phosphatase family protein [Hanstruepera neustonica]|uniref:Histidine phosphatase family protein n=1 Tax=Hanstruepera neustonica TaxID=1445657 RepID=A0A2K1DWC6_9FLAO|nr:histidine phosphatase family protein [Hanstruepera neustonica]PNQ72334.1 histidine phosphatase family protein [Hanstruepera neustonica]
MRKLILVRHAKSSWDHGLSDINRPLKERGFKDAKVVANKLLESNYQIDRVLTSNAVRAMTTAEIFVNTLKFVENIVILNNRLYDFSGENLVEVIKKCPININTLMIFGHNHAITNFVNRFGSQYINNVPTCGVVVIDFDIPNWQKLDKGETVLTLFPKDLR